MKIVKFDIRKISGYPFVANDEAMREYGYNQGHPLIRPYFESSFAVKYYYWKKLEFVCSMCKYESQWEVADIGCGPGIFLPTLAGFFKKVTAVDINQDDIKIADKITASLGIKNVSFARGDIIDLPIQKESIDALFAIDVFEHIKELDPLIEKLYLILKKNGIIVISAPTENNFNRIARMAARYEKPETHYHSSSDLEKLFGGRFKLVRKLCPFYLPKILSPVELFTFKKEI